ncbi:PadR family transcriptional regulator [Vibrio mediterranei]|uniref:PadR family transcriptional regulator n=1 Tax=Vibrio mediterranei TaxID=689 RepID=UPI004068C85D
MILNEFILCLLADRPLCPYDIEKNFTMHGLNVNPVYSASLRRALDNTLLKSGFVDMEIHIEKGKKKKYYSVTELGFKKIDSIVQSVQIEVSTKDEILQLLCLMDSPYISEKLHEYGQLDRVIGEHELERQRLKSLQMKFIKGGLSLAAQELALAYQIQVVNGKLSALANMKRLLVKTDGSHSVCEEAV